jgi:hypothetical protein
MAKEPGLGTPERHLTRRCGQPAGFVPKESRLPLFRIML